MAGKLDGRAIAAWLAVLLVAPAWPQPAPAAPYCLEARNLRPLCIYTDPNSCREAANKNHGYCSVNGALTLSQSGTSRFCVVQPDLTKLCIFADRQSCDTEAGRLHTACVTAGPNIGAHALDPFRLVRP